MCCLRRDVWLPRARRELGAEWSVRRLPRARRCQTCAFPGVRGGARAQKAVKLCRCGEESKIEPSARLARRASRTRSDRSREVPPRLLRSKTPRNDARCLPTSRSTTNKPYTRRREGSPRPRFRRIRRGRARRREHGALLWAIRRKLPPQPRARTPARMDLVLLLRFFGSGQGTIG